MRDTRARAVSSLALCTGLAFGVVSNLNAQTFQSVYGAKANDAARGGTIQTSDGGIISVGESQSFGAGDYDVYVVKTDCCGNLQWSTTYDLGHGGDDFGRKIRETTNDLGEQAFVIVGSTNDAKPPCTKKGADIFVMKIDGKGQLNWLQTYGGNLDDQGTNIELYNGGKEYIVSGRTNSFGSGDYDGYLARIDFNGGLIWARAYGGATTDGFNSLWPAANGDILATGATTSFSGNGTSDVWILRVNGKDGDCNSGWSYHYGGDKSNEVANDIVEDGKEYITVVGFSDAVTGSPDPYVLKVDPSGKCYCDNIFVNPKDGGNIDVFNEVASLGEANDFDLVAVGTNTSPVYGFGASDVLLVRIGFKCNPIHYHHYGMEKVEEGHSIDVVYDPAGSGKPAHYIMAGSTNTCCFGGDDLYLVRADASNYSSCCNDTEIKMEEKSPGFCNQPAPVCCGMAYVYCEAKTEPLYNESWKPICQCCKDLCPGGGNMPAPQRNDDRERIGSLPTQTVGSALRTTTTQPTAVKARRIDRQQR